MAENVNISRKSDPELFDKAEETRKKLGISNLTEFFRIAVKDKIRRESYKEMSK